jgi:hypothetical protein
MATERPFVNTKCSMACRLLWKHIQEIDPTERVIANLEVGFSVFQFEHNSASTGEKFELALSCRRSEREHMFL